MRHWSTYADDIVIVFIIDPRDPETSRARIIEEIRQLQVDAAHIDLCINHAKTKLMKIGNYSDFSSILINDNYS